MVELIYFKNLKTGVIWSISDQNLIKRLDKDDNFQRSKIIKFTEDATAGAADPIAAASSLLKAEKQKQPKDPEKKEVKKRRVKNGSK